MFPNTTEQINDGQSEDALRAFFAAQKHVSPSPEVRSRIMEAAKGALAHSTPSPLPSPYFNISKLSSYFVISSAKFAIVGAFATVLIIVSGIPFISKIKGLPASQEVPELTKIQVTAAEHNAEIDAALASVDSEAQMDDVGQLDDNDWEASHVPELDGPEGAQGHEIDAA